MKLIEWEINDDSYQEQIVIPEAQKKLAENLLKAMELILKTSRKLLCESRTWTWTLKASSGPLHCRPLGRNPAGQRPQNISHESSWFPQDKIAKRLGIDQKTIHNHLGEMPVLAFLLNADLSQGFTVVQVAQKHGWTEPMVWSQRKYHWLAVSFWT